MPTMTKRLRDHRRGRRRRDASASAATPTDIDVSKVIQLDDLELRDVGPDRRAPADPRRLGRAQRRPRRARPTRSTSPRRAAARSTRATRALGEVHRGRRPGHEASSPATSWSPTATASPTSYGFPLRIWAYDQPESIGWYAEEAVVGDWQLIHGAARLRPEPLGDRRAAAARADGVPPVAPRPRHLPGQGAARAAGRAQRAQLRRRRRRAVPACWPRPRATTPSSAPARPERRDALEKLGHRRHRPEAVQPLRRARTTSRRSASTCKRAHRRRGHAHRLRHAARPGVRGRPRRRRRAWA